MISIIAHRGYSARYRENSPSAWRAAVEAAADYVEVDVRFTADWQAVCLHDSDLARLAGRPERVADLPYAAIEGIEVGGQPVAPRLLEAFEIIPASSGIMLDVKDERPQALAELDALIRATAGHRIVLGLHDAASVAAMPARGHQAILALTPKPELGLAFIAGGCSLLRLWEGEITAEWLTVAADRGIPVWITTGGRGTERKTGDIDAISMAALAAMNIAGVLVNDPATARADLQTIQQHVLKDSHPMKKGSTLVVTFDGLRRDRATTELMPNLAAFMQSGTNFINSRSIFPSETRVATTSTVTGSAPGDHGLVANQYIHPAATPGRAFQTARYEDLMAADAIGQLIDRKSLGERLAAAGKTMGVVSTASPGATWMMNHKARTIGHPVFSVYGEPVSTPEMHKAALEKFGPVPAGATPNTARLDYATNVLIEIMYPQNDPDLCIFWMSDPDSTSHAFGVMGAETEESQRGADAAFGRIVAWWQSGQGPENLMVMSDHGQITGVKQVDPAVDLADFGDRLSIGSFNGIYLNDPNPAAIADLIERVAERPYCGLIFASTPDGAAFDGALPWSAVRGGHPRGATVGFTLRATPPSTENASRNDACFFAAHIEPGGGMHGGLNRGELSTVLAANGPAFRQTLVSEVPCWLPDIAPTLLTVLGLPTEGVTGRVLSEALVADGRTPDFSRRTLSARIGAHEQYLEQWLVEGRTIIDCGWTAGSGAWVAP